MRNAPAIKQLLSRIAANGTRLPPGANREMLDAFVTRTNIALPPGLREWLMICNGPVVGPGGLFGIQPTDGLIVDIEEHLRLIPEWRTLAWIPVASDGCGSFYVTPTNGDCGVCVPVVFVDHQLGYDVPAYIVASDIEHFVEFYLEEELGATYWPFDKERVVERDPQIEKCKGVRLPWDCD